MNSNQQYHTIFREWKCCIIIPTYNNDTTLKKVIESVQAYTSDVIVVNDGSTDQTADILASIPNIQVLTHEQNSGKGVALRTAFKAAVEAGYERAITLDSDGQHLAKDIPIFFDALEKEPTALIVGSRNMNLDNVPGTSNFGHRFSNFWYRVITGNKIPDTQSGYRLYPIAALKDLKYYTTKYELEMEVLVRAAWRDIPIVPILIDVYYPPKGERITHFRLITDFMRIVVLNTFFVFASFLYVRPKKFFKSLKKKSFKEFFDEYILSSDESNTKITLSVMLGLFLGVCPLWGYQIILIIFFAALLKMNKAIALIAGHISIPPMIPLILYSSYYLGGLALNQETNILAFDKEFSLELLKDHMLQYVLGSFILGFLLALVIGFITYLLLLVFRKKYTEKKEII